MAKNKTEDVEAVEETPEIEQDSFVTDEEVQEHIDEGNEYVDEEPTFPIPEEAEEEESEEVDSVDIDGGESGGTTQPDSTPPPQYRWSEDHFNWGRYLNLSRDEVASFAGGPAAFERMVQQVSSAVGANQQQEFHQDSGEFELDEDVDEDDPLSKMNRHYSDQMMMMRHELDQLKGVNNALQAKEQQRVAKSSADEFDGICNTMDEGLFGRGSYVDLGADSAGNRKTLADAASRLGHGYAARGETVPPMRQLVKEAFGASFGNNIENQTLRKASEKSKKMGSQTTAKPTHTDSEPANAEAAALKAAYKWQKEKGWI